MHDYDRRKTAATLDVHSKWQDIVEKHEHAEQHDFAVLLKELVPYFKSVGYDLDVSKSHIGKENHGSDGWRRSGTLVITEREENNVKAERPDQVKQWVTEATGLHAPYPTKMGEKDTPRGKVFTWAVDIGEY